MNNNELPITPFTHKNQYTYAELTANDGKVFGEGRPQLPVNEMLMIDSISSISTSGGQHGKGHINAKLAIDANKWFFACHFPGDPVMPGCLGLDAMWQLGGFYLGWLGFPGKGRAIGAEEVKFSGQVTNDIKLVEYSIDIVRVLSRKIKLVICDGTLTADGTQIYSAKGLKVAIF